MSESDALVPEIELDFHVEFPPPRPLTSTSTSVPSKGSSSDAPTEAEDASNDVIEYDLIWPMEGKGEEDNVKPLLVILLGWAGAQDKHLAKYSEFYLKKGCVVLRYIAPIKYLVLDAAKLPVLAARFVRLLQDLQLESHPTFFHVFSNGGSFMYSYILRELAHHTNNANNKNNPPNYKLPSLDLRGTIFDSAPAPRKLNTLFKALLNIFVDYSLIKYVIAGLFVAVLVAQIFWWQLKTCIRFCVVGEGLDGRGGSTTSSSGAKTELTPLQNWLTRICRLRNHSFAFIYSDNDDLISDREIEKIATVIKERGNPVDMVKFKGSEHVQHYRRYPKEYVDTITKFMRKTMESNSGPAVFWDEFN